MTNQLWGVHMGRHVGSGPIEGGYVAIGWGDLGDLRSIPPDREAFKAAHIRFLPDTKEGAVPVHAGTLFKYVHDIQAGDIAIYPSKHDRMVNIGRFTGQTEYHPDSPDDYPNRRKVDWIGHFPRSDFSQAALNEIGSAVTLFRVKRHVAEFLAKIGLAEGTRPADTVDEPTDDPVDTVDEPTDDMATGAISRQAEETTADFVIRRIMAGLSGFEFETLVAHLLECMGYTARVTQKSGDGGVDIIAHMDALGFQPPIVKVQCKRITSQTGNAEVNQLLGTLGEGEFGLFVNLGSFSRAASDLERNRVKLRLINGEQFVEMVLAHYAKLSPRYRTLIPLRQIYVPDLPTA